MKATIVVLPTLLLVGAWWFARTTSRRTSAVGPSPATPSIVDSNAPMAMPREAAGRVDVADDPQAIEQHAEPARKARRSRPQERGTVLFSKDKGVVRGRVLYNGLPVGYGSVRLTSADGDSRAARINDDGSYTITNLEPGPVTIVVREAWIETGTLPPAAMINVRAGELSEYDIEWSDPSAVISGQVTSSEGLALGGTEVMLRPQRDSGYGFRTKTNDQGRYSMPVPIDRTYSVSTGRGAVRDSRSDITPPASDVNLELPAAGQVRLAFLDSDTGEPTQSLAAARGVVQWRPSGTQAFKTVPERSVRKGELHLRVPTGTVDFRFSYQRAGYVVVVVEDVLVSSAPREPVVIELVRGAEVILWVHSEAGLEQSVPQQHTFHFVRQDQLASLPTTFPSPQEPDQDLYEASTSLKIEARHLRHAVDLSPGMATIPALPPGLYTLRAVPGDIRFEPEWVEVTGAAEQSFEFRWSE